MEKQFKTYDDLPLMLSVQDVAAVLDISHAGAYELVNWVVFPVTNFNAYLGITSSSRKRLPELEGRIIGQEGQHFGVCMYTVVISPIGRRTLTPKEPNQ